MHPDNSADRIEKKSAQIMRANTVTHTHTHINLQESNTKCVLLSCNKANDFLTIKYKY
jgi:hypothetical protein